MASPHLAAPPSSSLGHTPSSTSPAASQSTAATFGPGSGSGSFPRAASADHRSYSNSSGAGGRRPTSTSAAHHHASLAPALETKVIDGPGGRILCIADVRGDLESLNTLAAQTGASAIIHTGDFGFYEEESFERISDRTLRHLVQYSTLIPASLRSQLLFADAPGGGRGPHVSSSQPPPPPLPTTPCREMRSQILAHQNSPLLTQYPLLLSGALKLKVPVFTAWGACEDVRVLEKLRLREHVIENLHILDEASTVAVDVGGIRLRLFGLGGALVPHKLFDNGEGAATIAGGQGTMWTTMLQIGELVDTAQKCYDESEVRILVTHASPGREGMLMQLALTLKADMTISAGLHFRYGVSYNEFSVQNDAEQFRRKLLQAKSSFGEIWDSVRVQVEEAVDEQQKILLNNALAVTNRVPNATTPTGAVNEEAAWKTMWQFNLTDAAFGQLVFDIREGRISTEMKSVGFTFANRRSSASASGQTNAVSPAPISTNGGVPSPRPMPTASAPPTGPAQGMPVGPSRGGAAASKSPKSHSRSHTPSSHPQHTAAVGSTAAAEAKGPADSHPQSARPHSARGAKEKGNGEVLSGNNGANAHAKQGSESAKDAVSSQPEGGMTPSASKDSIHKKKAPRKKSGSGWSTKSETEKSADDSEAKGAAEKPTAAPEANEDKSARGGARGGRGGGRGRGGGGGRSASRGGAPGQERRKASGSAGGAETKEASSTVAKESAPKPAAM